MLGWHTVCTLRAFNLPQHATLTLLPNVHTDVTIYPYCSTANFKPEAGLSLLLKAGASGTSTITKTTVRMLPSVTTTQSMLAGYDKQRGGAFMDLPPKAFIGTIKHDIQTTGCSVSFDVELNGGFAFVFSWLKSTEWTDFFTVTVPYLEWTNSLALEVSSTPFTTSDGKECNMCNTACPSAKASLAPEISWGAKVGAHAYVYYSY
jgi:hypothetical protein